MHEQGDIIHILPADGVGIQDYNTREEYNLRFSREYTEYQLEQFTTPPYPLTYMLPFPFSAT